MDRCLRIPAVLACVSFLFIALTFGQNDSQTRFSKEEIEDASTEHLIHNISTIVEIVSNNLYENLQFPLDFDLNQNLTVLNETKIIRKRMPRAVGYGARIKKPAVSVPESSTDKVESLSNSQPLDQKGGKNKLSTSMNATTSVWKTSTTNKPHSSKTTTPFSKQGERSKNSYTVSGESSPDFISRRTTRKSLRKPVASRQSQKVDEQIETTSPESNSEQEETTTSPSTTTLLRRTRKPFLNIHRGNITAEKRDDQFPENPFTTGRNNAINRRLRKPGNLHVPQNTEDLDVQDTSTLKGSTIPIDTEDKYIEFSRETTDLKPTLYQSPLSSERISIERPETSKKENLYSSLFPKRRTTSKSLRTRKPGSSKAPGPESIETPRDEDTSKITDHELLKIPSNLETDASNPISENEAIIDHDSSTLSEIDVDTFVSTSTVKPRRLRKPGRSKSGRTTKTPDQNDVTMNEAMESSTSTGRKRTTTHKFVLTSLPNVPQYDKVKTVGEQNIKEYVNTRFSIGKAIGNSAKDSMPKGQGFYESHRIRKPSGSEDLSKDSNSRKTSNSKNPNHRSPTVKSNQESYSYSVPSTVVPARPPQSPSLIHEYEKEYKTEKHDDESRDQINYDDEYAPTFKSSPKQATNDRRRKPNGTKSPNQKLSLADNEHGKRIDQDLQHSFGQIKRVDQDLQPSLEEMDDFNWGRVTSSVQQRRRGSSRHPHKKDGSRTRKHKTKAGPVHSEQYPTPSEKSKDVGTKVTDTQVVHRRRTTPRGSNRVPQKDSFYQDRNFNEYVSTYMPFYETRKATQSPTSSPSNSKGRVNPTASSIFPEYHYNSGEYGSRGQNRNSSRKHKESHDDSQHFNFYTSGEKLSSNKGYGEEPHMNQKEKSVFSYEAAKGEQRITTPHHHLFYTTEADTEPLSSTDTKESLNEDTVSTPIPSEEFLYKSFSSSTIPDYTNFPQNFGDPLINSQEYDFNSSDSRETSNEYTPDKNEYPQPTTDEFNQHRSTNNKYPSEYNINKNPGYEAGTSREDMWSAYPYASRNHNSPKLSNYAKQFQEQKYRPYISEMTPGFDLQAANAGNVHPHPFYPHDASNHAQFEYRNNTQNHKPAGKRTPSPQSPIFTAPRPGFIKYFNPSSQDRSSAPSKSFISSPMSTIFDSSAENGQYYHYVMNIGGQKSKGRPSHRKPFDGNNRYESNRYQTRPKTVSKKVYKVDHEKLASFLNATANSGENIDVSLPLKNVFSNATHLSKFLEASPQTVLVHEIENTNLQRNESGIISYNPSSNQSIEEKEPETATTESFSWSTITPIGIYQEFEKILTNQFQNEKSNSEKSSVNSTAAESSNIEEQNNTSLIVGIQALLNEYLLYGNESNYNRLKNNETMDNDINLLLSAINELNLTSEIITVTSPKTTANNINEKYYTTSSPIIEDIMITSPLPTENSPEFNLSHHNAITTINPNSDIFQNLISLTTVYPEIRDVTRYDFENSAKGNEPLEISGTESLSNISGYIVVSTESPSLLTQVELVDSSTESNDLKASSPMLELVIQKSEMKDFMSRLHNLPIIVRVINPVDHSSQKIQGKPEIELKSDEPNIASEIIDILETTTESSFGLKTGSTNGTLETTTVTPIQHFEQDSELSTLRSDATVSDLFKETSTVSPTPLKTHSDTELSGENLIIEAISRFLTIKDNKLQPTPEFLNILDKKYSRNANSKQTNSSEISSTPENANDNFEKSENVSKKNFTENEASTTPSTTVDPEEMYPKFHTPSKVDKNPIEYFSDTPLNFVPYKEKEQHPMFFTNEKFHNPTAPTPPHVMNMYDFYPDPQTEDFHVLRGNSFNQDYEQLPVSSHSFKVNTAPIEKYSVPTRRPELTSTTRVPTSSLLPVPRPDDRGEMESLLQSLRHREGIQKYNPYQEVSKPTTSQENSDDLFAKGIQFISTTTPKPKNMDDSIQNLIGLMMNYQPKTTTKEPEKVPSELESPVSGDQPITQLKTNIDHNQLEPSHIIPILFEDESKHKDIETNAENHESDIQQPLTAVYPDEGQSFHEDKLSESYSFPLFSTPEEKIEAPLSFDYENTDLHAEGSMPFPYILPEREHTFSPPETNEKINSFEYNPPSPFKAMTDGSQMIILKDKILNLPENFRPNVSTSVSVSVSTSVKDLNGLENMDSTYFSPDFHLKNGIFNNYVNPNRNFNQDTTEEANRKHDEAQSIVDDAIDPLPTPEELPWFRTRSQSYNTPEIMSPMKFQVQSTVLHTLQRDEMSDQGNSDELTRDL